MDDAEQLKSPAPGRGEGGMDKRRGQSSLRRHLAHPCRVQGPLSLRKGLSPASAPKAIKNTLLIMFETRSGTIVRVSSVATKKVAPSKAHILAMVMLARKISKRRLKIASNVMLSGSRPSCTRIFAILRLSAALSMIRSRIVDGSALLKFIAAPLNKLWLSSGMSISLFALIQFA